jgi:hypothetical protein
MKKTTGRRKRGKSNTYPTGRGAVSALEPSVGSTPDRRARVVSLSARRLADANERAYRKRGVRALYDIKTFLKLSDADLGEIFDGIQRQAIQKWFQDGVPVDRVPEVDRIAEIVRELSKRFKIQRLPEVVRSPMPVFENRTIMDALRIGGSEPMFEFFRRWEALTPGAEPIRIEDYSTRKGARLAPR